jgi:prephenate dehydratase
MPIAFQGTSGAFGEAALVQHFGEHASRMALASFGDVVEAVATGDADAGVVPIENSLHGSVLETYDALLACDDVYVVGEVRLAVRHSLLAVPGTRLDEVTHACSHPQALAQCAAFLAEHGIAAVAATNTAVAARDVAELGAGSGRAAIASERAGALHGLDVLAADIQTRSDNTTRFFVLGAQPLVGPANKASLVFTTRNRPGALLACLEAIADVGLNLTKLESRPAGDAMWEYAFAIDVEMADRGELDGATVDALCASLAARATSLRLLGRYPAAT